MPHKNLPSNFVPLTRNDHSLVWAEAVADATTTNERIAATRAFLAAVGGVEDFGWPSLVTVACVAGQSQDKAFARYVCEVVAGPFQRECQAPHWERVLAHFAGLRSSWSFGCYLPSAPDAS